MKYICNRLTIIAIIIAFNSCHKALPDEPRYTFEYKYFNQTEYTINMKVFIDKKLKAEYKLNPYADSALTSGQVFLDAVGIPIPFYYLNPYVYQQADSIFLQFSNDRYINYSKGDSIFMYQAYEKTRFGDTLVIYQYYFTDEDYNLATPIQ